LKEYWLSFFFNSGHKLDRYGCNLFRFTWCKYKVHFAFGGLPGSRRRDWNLDRLLRAKSDGVEQPDSRE